MHDAVEPDVSSLLAQIDNLGKSLSIGSEQDGEARKELRLATRALSRAMEEPGDIVERLCYSVRILFPTDSLIYLDRSRS